MGSGMNRKEAEELASKRSYRWAVNNIVTGKGIKFRKATMIKLHKLAEIADWLDAEQTEPQNTCDTCIHKDNPWYMTDCDGCTNAQSNYVRKDELTESEYADAYNRGFASAVAMMADRKTEPQTYVINPQEPTNDDKCFECDDFFTCGGQCNKVEDEPQTDKDFEVTYTCSFTDCDNFKNFGFGEKCIECKRKQSEAKHKDEPQTDCSWK